MPRLKRPRLKDVLKTKPMPFQFEGIKFLWETDGNALLCDDMGLGKSLQALGWLAINPEARPAVIICPANGKYNWADQVRMHTHMKCEVLSGRKPWMPSADLVVINYDILSYWKETLKKWGVRAMIIDECHYIKNIESQRTQAAIDMGVDADHVIPMSGTPIINGPIDFWTALAMVDPDEFGDFWKYAWRYCKPKRKYKGRGWDFTGAANTKELHKRVKPYMIRRIKSEVMDQLPPKRRVTLPVDISNPSEYNKAKNQFLRWYKGEIDGELTKNQKEAKSVIKVGQLKQLAALGKLKAACEWITNYLEQTEEKLVVFCHHKAIMQALVKLAEKNKWKFATTRGKSSKEGHNEIRRFQEDDRCRLFLGSTLADGTGTTLTAASAMLFLELGWTPAEHDQAEDRIYRIGQLYSVTIYYMIARGTVDLANWELINQKRDTFSRVVDGKRLNQHKTYMVETLIERMTEDAS